MVVIIGALVRMAMGAARTAVKAGTKGATFNQKQKSGETTISFSKTESLKQKAHVENLEEIERLTTNLQKELIQKCQKQLGAQDITFTGNLRQHIEAGFQDEFKTVEANTPYAYFVEFGLPAGKWVNYDALLKWVQGKLGISDDSEARAITWKVLKKINAKGIEPKRFMKKGVKSLIARRGTIRGRTGKSRGKRAKSSRLSKIGKKVGRIIRTITKYVNKFNKVRRTGR